MAKNAECLIFSTFPTRQDVNDNCKIDPMRSCVYLQREESGYSCQKYAKLREVIDNINDKENVESRKKGIECEGILGFIIRHQELLLGNNRVETVSPLGNYHVGSFEEIVLNEGEVFVKAGSADFAVNKTDLRVFVEEDGVVFSSRKNSAYIGEAKVFFGKLKNP